ncbi:MAG TPA: hypothetical protein VIV12_18250 [Streptosporangiaceae bacterium]
MRRGWVIVLFSLALVAGLPSLAGATPLNSRVTRDGDGTTSYLRYNGTSDAVTKSCSHGRRAQMSPRWPSILTTPMS